MGGMLPMQHASQEPTVDLSVATVAVCRSDHIQSSRSVGAGPSRPPLECCFTLGAGQAREIVTFTTTTLSSADKVAACPSSGSYIQNFTRPLRTLSTQSRALAQAPCTLLWSLLPSGAGHGGRYRQQNHRSAKEPGNDIARNR
ncbi:hypothetical protein BaRGS_00022014 [Batillaria attramentaria]|uniref:Uncharacterized protein n=1 Tax=Batillaria attramentaria TaxID=370345 RepID=A0ABD0KI82_9CAEN